MNQVIAGEGRIYDRHIFADTKLASETLVKLEDQATSNIRANRLVLEELFTEELSQYPRNEEIVDRACQNIRVWIQLMFVCWAIYYGAAALSPQEKKPGQTNQQAVPTSTTGTANSPVASPESTQLGQNEFRIRGFKFMRDLLSTLTAVFIFFLYVEMSQLTLNDNSARKSVKSEVRDALNQKVVFAGAAAVVLFLDLAAFFVPQHRDVIQYTADTIIGCGSGVVMALVVGRLGSKFLDPGTWVVATLYLYAVIQPLAIFFKDYPNAEFLATTTALFLKAFLWLVFYWAFTDGRLWSYVVMLRKLLLGETRASHGLIGA